jgi:hypothetical protein
MENTITIDARSFEKPLAELARTMIFKVEREATKTSGIPAYIAIDIAMLLRMSNETLNLLWFINSDENMADTSSGKPIYTVVVFPLVRNMIDNLYNITYILKDPAARGRAFRLSGIMKEQKMIGDEETRYSGRPEWDAWIKESREKLELNVRQLKATQAEIDATPEWITFGKYVNQKGKGGVFNDHQRFLSTLLYGPWRQYSAQAHGGPEALRAVAMYFNYDQQPFDDRPLIRDAMERMRSLHLLRASTVLLATITELQAYFKFDGANINKRIREIWDVLLVHMDVKELYDARYVQLMKERHIT